MRRVPEITVYFWIAKVITTALGESSSDFFVHHFPPVATVLCGGVALLIALAIQLAAKRYVPWIYWLAVAVVAVAGTMAADVMHIQFHVPYAASTIAFAIVLAIVFVAWQRSEKTLSIHSIYTTRREVFYWLTVMATFALGTATGDMTAATWHLGYLVSGLMFVGLIALPAFAYWVLRANEVFTFWFAYILTRPLGASFADWMGKPRSVGGLAWGDGPVAFGLIFLLLIVVAYLAVTHSDVGEEETAARFE